MLTSFGVGLPVFLALDFVWLGLVSTRFYASHLGPWLRRAEDGSMAPQWTPALVFYGLVVVGLTVFVVPRVAAAGGGLVAAAAYGALFGLVVYGCWDLTNQSVLKDWPVAVTVVDMAWGSVVCGLTSVAMAIGARWSDLSP
jgi:uncharacterized membrane protein